MSVFIRLLTIDVFTLYSALLHTVRLCLGSCSEAVFFLFSFFFLVFPYGSGFRTRFFLLRKLLKKRAQTNAQSLTRFFQSNAVCITSCSEAVLLLSSLYIKNFPLIELLCCTIVITSAKSGAQLTTLIFFDSFFNGIESVTINSNNLEFSIFS